MTSRTILVFLALLAFAAYCQEPPFSATLDTKRTYMLGLMNSVRTNLKIGLVNLYLDASLNSIAQAHSADMVNRNFFSHTNPSGQTPQDRATAAGFLYPVGENIAYGASLTSIHAGLMASPPHYKNTIDKDWTRAGIGITYKGSVIYVAIVFSGRDFARYPVTQTEKNAFLTKLNTYITTKNTNVKTKIPSLSTHITNWLSSGSKQSIFKYLTNVGYPSSAKSYQMAKTRWSPAIGDQFTSGDRFSASSTTATFTNYGIGLYVEPNGMTTVGVVFST